MKAEDLLEEKVRAVSTTSPETAVIRVVERVRLERIGALVVSRDEKRIDGVLTERAPADQVRDVQSCLADADLEVGVLRMRTRAAAERR